MADQPSGALSLGTSSECPTATARTVVLSTQISAIQDGISRLHGHLGDESSRPRVAHGLADRRPRQKQRRLTTDESHRAAALYLAGLSMNEVATQLDVHRSAVVTCLRNADIVPRIRGIHPADAPEASALYLAGWSLERLGRMYGCTDSAVVTALRNQGVKTRPRKGCG